MLVRREGKQTSHPSQTGLNKAENGCVCTDAFETQGWETDACAKTRNLNPNVFETRTRNQNQNVFDQGSRRQMFVPRHRTRVDTMLVNNKDHNPNMFGQRAVVERRAVD